MLATPHRLVGTLDLDEYSGSTDQLILALLEEMGGPAACRASLAGASRAARGQANRLIADLDQLGEDLRSAWYQWQATDES